MFNVNEIVKRKDLLLTAIPKFKDCVDCTQRPSHYADVYDHIIDTVKYINKLTDNVNPMKDVLLMAALFHDIAKPDVKTEIGEIHFYGHDVVSADYWYFVAGRSYLESDEISVREFRQIDFLIRYHMVFHDVKKRLERGDSQPSIIDMLDPMLCYLGQYFPNDKMLMINALINLFRADMWASLKAKTASSRILLEEFIDTQLKPLMIYVIG